MVRVLVLGASGMLGSMVYFWLSRNSDISLISVPVFDASKNFDSSWLDGVGAGDVVVNCIGIINKFCRDDDECGVERAIAVNAGFPHALSREVCIRGARLIQIATDCVFSGRLGGYLESSSPSPSDAYGMTKRLGEVSGEHVLNIRCSIIGPERVGRRYSLLEWFLSQPSGSVLNGFAHHFWNGVTTLQFARLCEILIFRTHIFRDCLLMSSVHHFIPNQSLSKYDLLCLFRDTFDHDVTIRQVVSHEVPVDRTLGSNFTVLRQCFGLESLDLALADVARERKSYYKFFDEVKAI